MLIFKFGGASVKDAESVKKMVSILQSQTAPVITVISAMGKTTNKLEKLTEAYFNNDSAEEIALFEDIKQYHENIYSDLTGNKPEDETEVFTDTFEMLKNKLQTPPSLNYDYEYDQIVSFGEIISTQIIFSYLQKESVNAKWIDVRDIVRTNDNYRQAELDWETSKHAFKRYLNIINSHIITQGFIGSTPEGISTTLGREGSDYTASVLAVLAGARSVTIWKDVPGVMNADPNMFDFSEKLDSLSYQDAIELAFYGAKVIHPRTIIPIQENKIPLYVKSFENPEKEGTVIKSEVETEKMPPVFIVKKNQVLLSISPYNFSFVLEKHLSYIFELFHKFKAKVSLSQNSAISYSVCINCDKRKLPELIKSLKKDFKVLYNDKLELITVRSYNEEAIKKILKGKDVILEQKSRKTARFVVKENGQKQSSV